MLLGHLGGATAQETVVLPTELVVRQSAPLAANSGPVKGSSASASAHRFP